MVFITAVIVIAKFMLFLMKLHFGLQKHILVIVICKSLDILIIIYVCYIIRYIISNLLVQLYKTVSKCFFISTVSLISINM